MNFALAVSAFCLLTGPAQIVQDPSPPKPLFKEYFAKPTGNNGYEEYIRAADLTIDKKFSSVAENSFKFDSKEPMLARFRAVAAISDPIIRLIREGNTKQCFDPRPVTIGTTFEELTRFRLIAKTLNARAYCEYASGNVREGTRIIFDTLAFADNIPNTTLISNLVASACKSIVYAQLSDRLPMLGLPEAEMMKTYCDTSMQKSGNPKSLVEGELLFVVSDFQEIMAKGDKKELLELLGIEAEKENANDLSPSDKMRIEAINKMTRPEMQGFLQNVIEEIKANSQRILAAFEKPEKDWKFPDEELDDGTSLEKYIAAMMTPAWSGVARTIIIQRSILRLMRVHAAIIIRNWSFGQLPASLSELENPALITDPLTGKPFLYSVKENSLWELESEGVESTGRIALRYKRIFSQPSGGDPEPPLALCLR